MKRESKFYQIMSSPPVNADRPTCGCHRGLAPRSAIKKPTCYRSTDPVIAPHPVRRWTSRVFLFILGTGMLFMLLPSSLLAQQEWEKDGGIPNAEIEIVKDRKITLPEADRNFEKIPPRPAEPIKPEIVYDFKNLKFSTPDYHPLIRPLKLKQEDISKIYGNYASAGYGNYASPYLEAYFNTKRDKNKFYGAHVFHQSFGKGPVDDQNSASGSTQISLFGKSITRYVVASGEVEYENRNTYFYGYQPGTEPVRDKIHQIYNTVSFTGGIENSRQSNLNYSLQGSYSYLKDHYEASENETGLMFRAGYKISEKSRLVLDADYFLITRKDSMTQYAARNLLKIRPAVKFTPMEKLWLTVGANAAVENDTIGKNKSIHIYPNLRADYSLGESVLVYAGFTGDVDKVSLHSLSQENIWVNSNLNIFHTNRSAEFLTGFQGKLRGKVAWGSGFSSSILKNLYVFKNDSADRSKFDVTYVNTTQVNLFGELGFNPGESVKMSLRADYYSYSSSQVFHRPTYRLAFNSSYNVYNKLLFNINFIGQGGMKAYDAQKAATVSIPAALDLNARMDYFFSGKISVFLKLNNLLSNNYQMYLHYPVRGFQAIGGVSWCF